MRKCAVFLIGLFCIQAIATAQGKWVYASQFNAGGHFNLTWGKGVKFPGLKVFAGFNILATGHNNILLNYGPALSIYTKTIGANLNPLAGDIQVDFSNSFSFGYGWGGNYSYTKFFRTLHTGDFYNVATSKRNLLLLTSNLILNNHKRNQVVGSVTASFGQFTFNYYNDGAAPFTIIPLADNFDRYWTGGGSIFIHTSQGVNRAELNFDQFTGYTPLLYELSNLIGINLPLYTDSARGSLSTFNTSAYQLKIFTDNNFALDAGMVGSLQKNGRYYGIQDLIHMALKMSLHPNNDINRFFIGTSYNNRLHVKL